MKPSRDLGFALVEVLVAMTIMALVGIMAWRGMDALIRGREGIDRRANQDAAYTQLVNQFERDCQAIVRPEELGANPISVGAKTIWWVRQYRLDQRDAFLIVGYGMAPGGLQRWTSRPLLRRSEASALWTGISRDPDLQSSELTISLTLPEIVRQTAIVNISPVSGAGGPGVAPSGTAAPVTPSSNASAAPATPNTPAVLATTSPDQRGVLMQWWLRDSNLPLTRSCLMPGAL
jgi:general secretion pathway protein J